MAHYDSALPITKRPRWVLPQIARLERGLRTGILLLLLSLFLSSERYSPFRYTHRSAHVCVHRDRDTNNQPLMERGTWNRGSATKDVERGPCCRGAQRLDREEEFIVMGKLLMHTNFSPSFDDWKEKKKMFEISRDREGISQRQKRERKKEEEEKKIPEISNVIGTKGTFIMKAARFINFHRGREVPLLSKSPSAIINERRVTMKEQHRQHVLSFDGITLIRWIYKRIMGDNEGKSDRV